MWPRLQHPDGSFPNYIADFPGYRGHRKTRYGEAWLGYGLVQTGLRERDRSLVRSGLRGLNFAVFVNPTLYATQSEFESLAVASAFNLIRSSAAAEEPLFRDRRDGWERWLASRRRIRLGRIRGYSNHDLVEALAILELGRTQLRSGDPGSVLGGDAVRSRDLAERLVNVTIPAVAERSLRSSRGLPAVLVSDSPANPLAYHGLSLGLYARSLQLLGSRASPRAWKTLGQAANASWLLAAPDADLAYLGRSQEVAWTLPATAYGAAIAGGRAGVPPSLRAKYAELAVRSLGRLAGSHGSFPRGFFITPSLGRRMPAAVNGLDAYAGVPSFTGLTLGLLNWAIEQDPVASTDGYLAADVPGVAVLSRGESTFVTAARRGLWFAVKLSASRYAAHDLRYDFGLVGLKRLSPSGGWRELLALRPRTGLDGRDSAGPLLLRRGRVIAWPVGEGVRAERSGRLVVRGRYRGRGGRPVGARARFTYEPIACGLRLTFPAPPRIATEYSLFLRDDHAPPVTTARRLRDGEHEVTLSRSARVHLTRGYASGTNPTLVRARLTFPPARRRTTVSLRICAVD